MSARYAAVFTSIFAISACASDSGGASEAQSRQLPIESSLCKVAIGYDIPSPNGPTKIILGTHADDVRAVLGEPDERSDTQFSYDWCVGEACAKHATATIELSKFDRCYRDGGKPITPPYWVTGIRVDGFERPSCWVVAADKRGGCPECLSDRDIVECAAE